MGIVQNPQIAQNSDDNKKTQVRYIPATTEIPLGGEIKYSLIHGEDFEKYDMPGVSELFNFLSQIPEVLSMISPYWISGTTYNVSDMKIYNNKLYICNKKHVAGNDNFPDTSQFWKNIVYEESIHSYINDIRNGIYEYVNSIIHTHDYSKDIRVSADGLRKFVEENTKRQMQIVELNINVGKKEAKTYTDKQNSNQYNKLISEIHAAETRAKNHIHTIFKDEYDILLEKQIHGDQVQKTYTDTREGIIRRDTENNLTKAIDETITHSDNEDHKLDRKLSDTKTELTNKILENANSIHNNYTYHTNVRNNDYNHFTSEDARIEKKLEDFFCDTGWMIKKDSTWTCPMSGHYNVRITSSASCNGEGGYEGRGGFWRKKDEIGGLGIKTGVKCVWHNSIDGTLGGDSGNFFSAEKNIFFSKNTVIKVSIGKKPFCWHNISVRDNDVRPGEDGRDGNETRISISGGLWISSNDLRNAIFIGKEEASYIVVEKFVKEKWHIERIYNLNYQPYGKRITSTHSWCRGSGTGSGYWDRDMVGYTPGTSGCYGYYSSKYGVGDSTADGAVHIKLLKR